MKLWVWTGAVQRPAVSMITGAAFVGTWKEASPGCTQFVILQRARSLPEGSPRIPSTRQVQKMDFCAHRQAMLPPQVLSAELVHRNFKFNWLTSNSAHHYNDSFQMEGGKKSESNQALLNWEQINPSL